MKFIVLVAALLLPFTAAADLLEDETDQIEVLPSTYPKSWVFVPAYHGGGGMSGRVAVIDVGAEVRNYKGALYAGYVAGFATNNSRHEAYVLETFYSRGHRGTRTDVITIYDQASLMPKGEILMAGNKRLLSTPNEAAFRLGNDDRWAYVYNYTPAASVSIVDLEGRQILAEIPIPGCSLVYPLAGKGFMTLCGYGEALSLTLDDAGGIASEHRSEVFNDIDDDPYFMKVTRVGDTIYLPSFKGKIIAIDLSGTAAQFGDPWSLVTDAEAKANWRPGGWQPITSDTQGRLYVLMHADGKNGSHKTGGSEVWVFDPATQRRLARLKLATPADVIEVTKEAVPRLVAANFDGLLDVYDAATGTLERTILLANGASANHIEAVE